MGLRLYVDGRDVAPLLVADTFGSRLRGMLGRRPLPPAMLLRPANSVHGLGMTRTLDVAALDDDLRVRAVLRLRPFGLTRARRSVTSVLEAPAGSFAAWALHDDSSLEIREGAHT